MKSLSAKSLTKTIAAFMVFWLSGVLFLFCCGTMQAQNKEFCPLAAKGQSHCDKAKGTSAAPVVSKQTGDQNLDCCGFLPAVFDKTRKIEKTEQTAPPVAKIKVDAPRFLPVENNFEAATNYRAAILNQNKIFIKNCVFRI